MPFIPIPNVSMHTVNYTWLGQQVQNVFHVLHGSAPTSGMIGAANDIIVAWWNTEIEPNVSNQVEARSVIGTSQHVVNGPQFTTAFPPGSVGQLTSPSMPSGVTVAVSWRTGNAGRSFRGRTYHVGLVEAQVVDNEIDSGTHATLIAGYVQLVTDLAVADTPLVVASRYTNNAPRTTGVATVITSTLIDTFIDSQRRRLAGRGR